MFFMIGRYVREYNPKCSLKVLGLAALLPCLINPLFSTFVVSGRPLMLIAGNSSSGLFGTIQAVAVFLLLYKLDIQNGVANGVSTGLPYFPLIFIWLAIWLTSWYILYLYLISTKISNSLVAGFRHRSSDFGSICHTCPSERVDI